MAPTRDENMPNIQYAEKAPLIPDTIDEDGMLLDAPKDRLNLCYIIFFLQGLGMLFPWNAFITVTGYFKDRLLDSTFQNNFELYITVAFQLSNIFMLLVVTRYQHRFDVRKRVIYAEIVMFLVFLATTIMVKIAHIEADWFFTITLVLVLVAGATTAWLQGALFGMAGYMPFRYMQALMAGQGLGGLFISLINIFTLLGSTNTDQAAFIFFLISLIVLLCCIAGYIYILKSPVLKYYVRKNEMASEKASLASTQASPVRNKRLSYVPSVVSISETFQKIKGLMFGVFFTFMITLALFPGLASDIVATSGSDNYQQYYFIPISCFLVFNLFDTIGRTLAGIVRWPKEYQHRFLKYPILARIVFIPLFMLCNIEFIGDTNHLPQVFTSDVFPYVFMALLATTNGYCGSLCMMYGPNLVEPIAMETAGSMMALALTVGLGVGSFLSFGLRALMCHCNPFSGS